MVVLKATTDIAERLVATMLPFLQGVLPSIVGRQQHHHHYHDHLYILSLLLVAVVIPIVLLAFSSFQYGPNYSPSTGASTTTFVNAWSRRILFFVPRKKTETKEYDKEGMSLTSQSIHTQHHQQQKSPLFKGRRNVSGMSSSWQRKRRSSDHMSPRANIDGIVEKDHDDNATSRAFNASRNSKNNSSTKKSRLDSDGIEVKPTIVQKLFNSIPYVRNDNSNERKMNGSSVRTTPNPPTSNITGNSSSNTTKSKWSFWDDNVFLAPFNLLLPPNHDDEGSNDDDIYLYDDDGKFWSELQNDEEFYYGQITGVLPNEKSLTETSLVDGGTSMSPTNPAPPNHHQVNTTNEQKTTVTFRPSALSSPSSVFTFPPPLHQKRKMKTVTHFCFLVHGYRGLSRDLSYMQSVMRKQARIQQRKRWIKHVLMHEQRKKRGRSHSIMMQGSRDEEQIHKRMRHNESTLVNSQENVQHSSGTTHSVSNSSLMSNIDNNELSTQDNVRNERVDDLDDVFSSFVWQEFVVHSVTSNERRTDDGVRAGGERVTDEIIEFIRQYMINQKLMKENVVNGTISSVNNCNMDEDNDEIEDVTISILGNSLGGLYARYVVAKLFERCNIQSIRMETNRNQTTAVMMLDNKYRLHWNIFCTTATPHLGLSGHTFLPLSRTAEYGVASALGETGRDLFRFNPLLHEMATDPIYLRPLGRFRKRTAYANAYGTDFAVPVSTAAFLSESSSYPHHFIENDAVGEKTNKRKKSDSSNDIVDVDVTKTPQITDTLTSATSKSSLNHKHNLDRDTSNSLVVATLHTRSMHYDDDDDDCNRTGYAHYLDHVIVGTSTNVNESDNVKEDFYISQEQELARMSTGLDSLGWKKVFVDVRKEIPRISISKSLLLGSVRTSNVNIESSSNCDSSASDGDDLSENTATTNTTSKLASERFVRDIATKLKTSLKSMSPTKIILSSTSTATAINSNTSKSMNDLKEQNVVPSRDVAAAVVPSTPLLSSDKDEISLHWPVGHNMIVAFSRSRLSAYMNKAGRPVVDELSKEIVDDIFAYWPTQTYSQFSATTQTNTQTFCTVSSKKLKTDKLS